MTQKNTKAMFYIFILVPFTIGVYIYTYKLLNKD